MHDSYCCYTNLDEKRILSNFHKRNGIFTIFILMEAKGYYTPLYKKESKILIIRLLNLCSILIITHLKIFASKKWRLITLCPAKSKMLLLLENCQSAAACKENSTAALLPRCCCRFVTRAKAPKSSVIFFLSACDCRRGDHTAADKQQDYPKRCIAAIPGLR